MVIKKIKAHVVNKCVLCQDNKVTDGGMLCDSCRNYIKESLSESPSKNTEIRVPDIFDIEIYSEWR